VLTTDKSFEEYFAAPEIIDVLCLIRVRRSKVRHNTLFHRRLSTNAPAPRHYDKFNECFPGRKIWHRFRPRVREAASSQEIHLHSLRRAVRALGDATPRPAWAAKLDALVARIRTSALIGTGHVFSAPAISAQSKSGNEYRPIASFPDFADKVIDSIVGRYLREHLDVAFEPCSVAFRASQPAGFRLDRDTAIAAICEFRRRHSALPLYVAECDIRGFFDCVSHKVALAQLERVIDTATARKPGLQIDPRAIAAFSNYLRCYSFSSTVRSDEIDLKRRVKNPEAHYKWPESGPNSLADYYADPASRDDIGVPQGGALSCLVSNLILDFADKEVRLAALRCGQEILYFRYCDDMVIITAEARSCTIAFSTYLSTLRFLKLPFHKPEDWHTYGVAFYENSKTKAPYVWHGLAWFNYSPWIQFLGYQIRYDGLLRIREKSIEKHKKRINEILRDVIANVDRQNSRVNRGRLLYRLHQKLIAVSVGRIRINSPVSGPKPMCWASGFRALHERPFIGHYLRAFDRLRAASKYTLGELTAGLKLTDRKPSIEFARLHDERSYHGRPFSYDGQFRNAGGQDLVFAPYRPSLVEEKVLIPCYRCFRRQVARAASSIQLKSRRSSSNQLP